LDETREGEIILRGVIDPESLKRLRVGLYQREVLPFAKIKELVGAFKAGSAVPDIDLGMRGERFMDRQGCFYLQDPVFVVDGQQRVTAAIQLLQEGGDKPPHLGATVHFGTDENWERNRFRILNAERTKLSSNILLRNLRTELPAVELLYELTANSPDFVMNGRVSWNQRMKREELVTAITFLRTAGALHSHLGPGRASNYLELAQGLQKIHDKIGPIALRDNIVGFWNFVEQAWGIRRVTFKEGATYLRATFLSCLALLFSCHHDFWRGKGDTKLFVDADLLRKLSLFPITDPSVANLASAGGAARKILYALMRDQVNSGKRTKRLRPRPGGADLPANDVNGDE
jgi:hypothetical protein